MGSTERLTSIDLVAFDMAGARAGVAGVISVMAGSQGIGRLGVEGHTHIIAGVAELPALLASAFPLAAGLGMPVRRPRAILMTLRQGSRK